MLGWRSPGSDRAGEFCRLNSASATTITVERIVIEPRRGARAAGISRPRHRWAPIIYAVMAAVGGSRHVRQHDRDDQQGANVSSDCHRKVVCEKNDA